MQKTFRKPHQFKRKKSIFGNRFFWLGILILIIIGTISYFLFFLEIFYVEKVIITGEEKVSKEDIKLLTERRLENKILFFKTRSIFLVNLDEIRKDILNNFPQVAEVEIGRGIPDALNILVIERLGLAIWCQVHLSFLSENFGGQAEQCFLLDNGGVIFEKVPSETDLIKIVDYSLLIEPEADGDWVLNLGENVIEKERLSKILKIAPKLKLDLEIPLREFLISAEGKLTVVTIEDWEIYFDLQGDINWQLTKLGAVLEEKIPPEKREDLEYIELRFGNFAPFKYKN